MDPEKIAMITELAPIIVAVAGIAVGGWVLTTWMRIKNGYPLENQWGKSVYPKTSSVSSC